MCILYRQLGVEGRIYKGSRGGREGKVQKRKATWELGKDLENGSSQNFEKNSRKGEGGCASTMCIGLECLCDWS